MHSNENNIIEEHSLTIFAVDFPQYIYIIFNSSVVFYVTIDYDDDGSSRTVETKRIKSMVLDSEGEIFIADDSNIRSFHSVRWITLIINNNKTK